MQFAREPNQYMLKDIFYIISLQLFWLKNIEDKTNNGIFPISSCIIFLKYNLGYIGENELQNNGETSGKPGIYKQPFLVRCQRVRQPVSCRSTVKMETPFINHNNLTGIGYSGCPLEYCLLLLSVIHCCTHCWTQWWLFHQPGDVHKAALSWPRSDYWRILRPLLTFFGRRVKVWVVKTLTVELTVTSSLNDNDDN